LPELIAVNDDHWPLAVAVHNGMPTIEAMDAYYAHVDRWYARNERHAVVTCLANTKAPGGDFRKHEAKRLERYNDECKRLVIGTGLIAPSAVIRVALNSIFFLKRPPSPYTVARNTEDAWIWLDAIFKAEGLQIPITSEKLSAVIESLRAP